MTSKLLSMTGYGETTAQFDNYEWRCVVQSVNSRNLDVRFRFPSGLHSLEIPFRKHLQKFIARGKVEVAFSFISLTGDDTTIGSPEGFFNADWVLGFCKSGAVLFDQLKWQTSDNLRSALLKSAFAQRGAFSDTALDINTLSEPLLVLFQSTLVLHNESRLGEGSLLAADIVNRLSILENYLQQISKQATSMPEIFKDRINDRLNSIIDNNQFDLDPARVTQEIAHLIDKADISEEIVRFNAHINQFLVEINDSNAERKGKKLEFVVQEMLREINTIGSKANLLEITRGVVEVKNELEKIREQVQNIV